MRTLIKSTDNIFESIPIMQANTEIISEILSGESIRIEKIYSNGYISDKNFWYDLDENEWVILLQGNAIIESEDSTITKLSGGDYIFIPAHCKHRVTYTSSSPECIWVAFFWK